MNIDERIEALTMSLELATRDIQDLRSGQQILTEHMSTLAEAMTTLARAVTDHERRLNRGNL